MVEVDEVGEVDDDPTTVLEELPTPQAFGAMFTVYLVVGFSPETWRPTSVCTVAS
jgi:hypothetical protein